MFDEEDEFKEICVSLILDFCRSILDDQVEIDDVTISQVNEFCQEWIDENFGKDQTVIEERIIQNSVSDQMLEERLGFKPQWANAAKKKQEEDEMIENSKFGCHPVTYVNADREELERPFAPGYVSDMMKLDTSYLGLNMSHLDTNIEQQ